MALIFSNASVYDPYWSVQPIFIVIALAIGKELRVASILPIIAICIWGVRLTANWAYTFGDLTHQDWRYTMLKEKTGISVKTTTLGHIQRGGSPTMNDRVLAAKFACRAVDLLLEGQTNRVVGIKDNKITDCDITEALSKKREFDKDLYNIAHILSL